MILSERIEKCSENFDVERKTIKDPKAKSNSIYKIENKEMKNYSIINFDDCVFKSDERKCDFGMKIEKENTIHFIELKGSDNNKGLEQLYETIINTKDIYINYKKKVRLIVSKAEAPRNINQRLINKIGEITGDTMNGKKDNFIKANNQFVEKI